VTLVQGRGFQESDSQRAPRVTIINETAARHYFGSENPLGRTIYFPKVDAQNRYVPFARQLAREDGTEIVGVVRDAKECVQIRLVCSVGDSPTGGKVRNLRSLGRIRGGNEAGEADRQSHLRDGERVTGPQRK
jgi:hypothetical protein